MAGALSTTFDQAEHSPGLQLWRVTHSWQAVMRRALAPHDLTHVQFVLLASLVWIDADGPVTQRALADHAGTDPMMTSQVLRALEAKGLVERRPHPDDSRARSLVATSVGVALANRANESVEAADREFFAPLGADLQAFAGELGRLVRPRA
ncbi:MAG: MarR family winged helix-turn-helix transcriptional regulator [Actinobacteria bacterium]|nr:MarR family winged helix-turn-helix transcriptional regulator [Actinomycetota bacterium]MCG2803131.1 MarR family winged helix-turn-helix transcriptional regulator [Cellulomonas sp.]